MLQSCGHGDSPSLYVTGGKRKRNNPAGGAEGPEGTYTHTHTRSTHNFIWLCGTVGQQTKQTVQSQGYNSTPFSPFFVNFKQICPFGVLMFVWPSLLSLVCTCINVCTQHLMLLNMKYACSRNRFNEYTKMKHILHCVYSQ